MIVVYSTPTCPKCVQLKAQLKARGKEFVEMVVGVDVTREKFMEQHPQVRSFPYVVELKD